MLSPIGIGAIASSGGASEPVSNWWEAGGATGAVAAYQPIGAASLAASYTNLANPGTFDATPIVAPTWATGTGWTFNGTTQYLNSGVVPASGYSMIVQFNNASGADKYVAGLYEGSNATLFAILPNFGTTRIGYFYGALVGVIPVLTAGNIAITSNNGYRDGTAESPTLGAISGITKSIYIGARHNSDDSGSNLYIGNIQALVIYNNTLDASEVAAVAAAMAALP